MKFGGKWFLCPVEYGVDKRTGSMYILPGLRTKNEPTSLEEPVFCPQTQVKVWYYLRGLGTLSVLSIRVYTCILVT
jgi:hypothetical protein